MHINTMPPATAVKLHNAINPNPIWMKQKLLLFVRVHVLNAVIVIVKF